MSPEFRILKILGETIFMILVELNFSPSMMRDIREKKKEFEALTKGNSNG